MKIGQKAPDFIVQGTDLSDARFSDFKSKVKLVCSVPSLDTPVCDAEIHRFNLEASQVASDVEIIFISMDLPFAQKRFCAAAGINNVKTFSEHRYADFGKKYGVLIKDLRLLARAIFIIDKDDTVRYVEYVKETGMQPDYAAALKALKETANSNH
jgi:thiol peroxidase